jgi:hypothetical protein
MKSSSRRRNRRNRIATHLTVLGSLALGALVLPDDVRVWLLCGIPVAFVSAIKLWVLYETRRRTPEERKAARQRRLEREQFANARQSSVMHAAGWKHGFLG